MEESVERTAEESAAALIRPPPPPPASPGCEIDCEMSEEELISGMVELAAICTENNIALPEHIRETLRSIEAIEDGGEHSRPDVEHPQDRRSARHDAPPQCPPPEEGAPAGGPGPRRHVLEEVRARRQYRYSGYYHPAAPAGALGRNASTRMSMGRLGPVATKAEEFHRITRMKNPSVDLRMRDVSYVYRAKAKRPSKKRRGKRGKWWCGGGEEEDDDAANGGWNTNGGGEARSGDDDGDGDDVGFVDEENGGGAEDVVAEGAPRRQRHERHRRLSRMSIKQMVSPVTERALLDSINLRFESGKMYLVLGSPGSGKSLLLKAIAGRLRRDKSHHLSGTVSINGQTCEKHPDLIWPRLVAFSDQVDRHHALLTVREVLDFAFQCRARGTHRTSEMPTDDPDVEEHIRKCDAENWRVNLVCSGTNMAKVADTFVGDPTTATVPGISGGERRRVTIAEPWMSITPFLCLDELSTGLDSATTFEIVKLIGELLSYNKRVVITSLLQPPPEVVALFDELILLDKGRTIYAGPVDQVVSYFGQLGYYLPDRMDMADWLQALPTPDGVRFLKKDEYNESDHRSHDEFVEAFKTSNRGIALAASIKAPLDEAAQEVPLRKEFTRRHQNSWRTSLRLCFRRELLLLKRDKRRWKAKIFQNVLMGLISGTLFFQVENQVAKIGVLFYALIFVTLGNVPPMAIQLANRGIFYKEKDANYYPTWTFVLGRALASFPMYTLDSVLFGTMVFYFSGLAYRDGASVANYFIFMLILLIMGVCSSLVYSVFSSSATSKPLMQARLAVLLSVFIIFSGFTVQADVIPPYWKWLYWLNLFAWAYRALIVNEFQSGKYENTSPSGDQIMEQFGLVDRNGEPYGFEWVWWGILFVLGSGAVGMILSTLILDNVRVGGAESGGGASSSSAKKNDGGGNVGGAAAGGGDVDRSADDDGLAASLPFKRVDLTFRDIRYTVESSLSKEPIELLKGVSGCIEAGKMTALMGSSGAGKTTLMDVLALRKTTGEVEGTVKLNGHPQESHSFRRCTGYVEQFDMQSPQLTVFETVEFSARLRLDRSKDSNVTPQNTLKFVNSTLEMLELTPIRDALVGSDLSKTGLTFEQRKRLSIAVELVANPSIIFLDEPTSGLDARGARVVMRGLKKIASTGRAICATIHQPSLFIFNAFDALLLLQRGGETVFFGDLGKESRLLIEYLEQYEETPRIIPGENPATWMLKVIGTASSGSGGECLNYATAYDKSKQKEDCLDKILAVDSQADESNRITYPHKYATDKKTQSLAVYNRLNKIYWRSPSYNLSRVIVSAIIALMMGSQFAAKRVPTNESDMNSRVTSVFITAMFLGVTSFNTTLPVFEVERNMFYRHKAALMYNQAAINLAFTLAEVKFVLAACMVFMICFYFLMGFSLLAYKFFLFYVFTFLGMFTWTYLGQMTMSLLASSVVAQQMGSLLVGMSTLFGGIVIRPQMINSFWIFMYWLLPVHYIIEGMIASQFHNDDTRIEPYPGSDYSKALGEKCGEDEECWMASATAEFWVKASFGGFWAFDHIWYCVLYLVAVIVASRVITYIALTKLNYLSK